MEVVEEKARLRAELRALRDTFVADLDSVARTLAFRAPPTPLRALIEQAECIAGYHPVGSEADPSALLLYAIDAGKTVALPHVERASVPMRFLRWTPGEPLLPGPFGIEQPDIAAAPEVVPDLFLAPLLGFDRRLQRLGQGAGFYDRAFARYTDAVKVGVAWHIQELDWVPDDPWDVPLDAVLTEREWIA